MIGVLVKGWPRLSETFIAQELLAVQNAGIPFIIISLRRPTGGKTHGLHDQITAPVIYLPEYLHREPLRVLCGVPRLNRALAWQAWRDLRRGPSLSRLRRVGQALALARELPSEVRFLYAHFLHTPATVAHYTSLLTGLPFAISAHAKDIYTSPAWDIRQKLDVCQWLATCTRANAEHLQSHLPPDRHAKIHLLYHGLDTFRFPPVEHRFNLNDGRDAANPVQIVSVGRAVAKKGYDDLLAALARLSADLHWRFTHIGDGPQLPALRQQAAALGLQDRISWRGAQTQADVLELLRQADIFALASRITQDGDRDGLPNVLMEAMSQSVACVATRVSAIPELIEHGSSGTLVEMGDIEGLESVLRRLIQVPLFRQDLAMAGARRVRAQFTLRQHIVPLLERLRG